MSERKVILYNNSQDFSGFEAIIRVPEGNNPLPEFINDPTMFGRAWKRWRGNRYVPTSHAPIIKFIEGATEPKEHEDNEGTSA